VTNHVNINTVHDDPESIGKAFTYHQTVMHAAGYQPGAR
jgi:hypothetical protein